MFLKFLVDNKIVAEENLLEAVILQYDSMPSLLRLLKEDNIFNSKELFSLLLESMASQTTVFDLLKKEGRLTPDDLLSLVNSQNASANSLGDILVEKGFVEREKFDLALRDYSKVEKVEMSSPEPVQEEKSEKETEVPAGISAAALESLKAVGGFDADQIAELEEKVSGVEEEAAPVELDTEEVASKEENILEVTESKPLDLDNVIVVEYLDFYNDEKQSELLVIANRFRLKGREKDLNLLHESLTKILSLCKLSNFDFQVKLLEAYEELFSKALNDPNCANQDWRPEPFQLLEILWDFRKKIELGHAEIEILTDPEIKNKYMESIKKILHFSKRSA